MKKKESYMIYKRFLKKLRDFKLDDEETKAKINRKCSKKSLYFKYNGDPSKSKVIRRYEKVSDLGFMYYTFELEIKKEKKKRVEKALREESQVLIL